MRKKLGQPSGSRKTFGSGFIDKLPARDAAESDFYFSANIGKQA